MNPSSSFPAGLAADSTPPAGIPEGGLWDGIDPDLARRTLDRLAIVEERLRAAAANADSLADQTSRHLVEAGGKRLRPVLALLAAEFGEADREQVVDVAVTVELTHLASLYHDDVMDSAPVRRGAPSAHEVWGNSVAILTGDLLFARASLTVAKLGPEAVRLQAETFERLCLGQLHETVGPRPGEDPGAHYLQVLADKTASLLATSARLGAMYAGCSQQVIDIVAEFGELVGIGFQLSDDVIDLAPADSATGKTPGTDLREGVVTMPVLLLRERVLGSGIPEDAALLAAIEGDLGDDEILADVVARLRDHPVAAEAKRLASDYAERAVRLLDGLPDVPARAALTSYARALVERAR
ncbi:polyprenyl synthetase family protein [Rarobacter faecitabidus]|uniref:polyprenyl synthetase family protein n=1 Tax=Rarobacter faecitabidus TaxID=13243 RepID=UPI00337A360A